VGEIPHEKALVERLKDAPFALLGINTDDDKDVYRKKAADYGVTWRSSWQGSTEGPIPTAWGVNSYPTIFVLDEDHVIRHINARGEELGRVVDGLLAEMKPGAGAAR
jgi:alkyl hydroperoxide reductase subunit AhpC